MWKLYGGEEGLAIKIHRTKFQSTLKTFAQQCNDDRFSKIIAGRIKYKDFYKLRNLDGMRYLGFRKDLSFSHEKEYRVIVKTKPHLNNNMNFLKIKLENMHDLIDTIITSPLMPNELSKLIKDKVNGINSSLKVVKSRIMPVL